MTSRRLAAIDAGSWFNEQRPEYARREFTSLNPPLLEDVLRRYSGRANFFIDVKEPEGSYVAEAELIRVLDACRVSNDEVIVGSLSEPSLRKLRSIEPSLSLAQVLPLGSPVARSITELERISCHATAVVPPKEMVDERMVRTAARAGMQVIPYTINDPAAMASMVTLGVDGIITDFPDRLDEVLVAHPGRVTTT